MTEDLITRVKRHEGFCHVPKPDHQFKGDSWVVGWGCDITHDQVPQYANGISDDDAEEMLADRIHTAQMGVNNALPWTSSLSQIRQEVLVEMAFQMGIKGLLEFRLMLADIKNGNFNAAANEMRNSKWDKKEAKARADELANLLAAGVA